MHVRDLEIFLLHVFHKMSCILQDILHLTKRVTSCVVMHMLICCI